MQLPLSRILAIPFVIMALAGLYMAWEVDANFSALLVPGVLGLAVVYTFSPQIDWWWSKRNPPDVAEPIKLMLEKGCKFYQALNPDDRRTFRQRVAMFIMGTEFMPQGSETVPEDLKAMIAASAVTLTFGQEQLLFPKFENVVLYPRPFPTPQFPTKFHASEIFEEDGVVLFSAEQLAHGFMQSDLYYHIGLHEYAKIFQLAYPNEPWPDLDESAWPRLEQISGFSREAIVRWINLDPNDIPPLPVSISHFFCFPERFKEVWPELFDLYHLIFKTPTV